MTNIARWELTEHFAWLPVYLPDYDGYGWLRKYFVYSLKYKNDVLISFRYFAKPSNERKERIRKMFHV